MNDIDHFYMVPKNLNFNPIFQSNVNVRPHDHDYYEILIVTSGNIAHTINDENEQLFFGDAYLIAPSTVHSVASNTASTHIDLMFNQPFFAAACDNIQSGLFENLTSHGALHFQCPIEAINLITSFTNQLLTEADSEVRNCYEKIIVTLAVGVIFSHIKKSINYDLFENKCIQYFNRYFIFPDALSLIENEFNYNKVYFCKKFKSVFKCTPKEYITDLRLKYAAYLLEKQGYSVNECCEAVGIVSRSYFIKIFKERYNVAPSSYKKQSKK